MDNVFLLAVDHLQYEKGNKVNRSCGISEHSSLKIPSAHLKFAHPHTKFAAFSNCRIFKFSNHLHICTFEICTSSSSALKQEKYQYQQCKAYNVGYKGTFIFKFFAVAADGEVIVHSENTLNHPEKPADTILTGK
jgi:hypothetical protein